MREDLQEATQRALIEGYKNLKENKSKKIEAKLEDIQMEIYEMIQTARRVDKQDKDTNKRETAYAIMQEYPEINRKELINYISKKADEIYAGDYDEEKVDEKELARQLYGVDNDCEYTPLSEKRTFEYEDGYSLDIQSEIEDDMFNEETGDIDGEGKIWANTGDEQKFIFNYDVLSDEIYFYEPDTGESLYIENPELLSNIRSLSSKYKNELSELTEGKRCTRGKMKPKLEADGNNQTLLEKAFEEEVIYHLQSLAMDGVKEAGKAMQDGKLIDKIVDVLVNESDDIWEDIFLRIEDLAGIDYRNK